MNKLIGYIEECYNELMYKVTWPSWKELSSSAVVVMIASLVIALLILGMDQASSLILRKGLYPILLG